MVKIYLSSLFLNSDFGGLAFGLSFFFFFNNSWAISLFMKIENMYFNVLFINHQTLIYVFHLISILLLFKKKFQKLNYSDPLLTCVP